MSTIRIKTQKTITPRIPLEEGTQFWWDSKHRITSEVQYPSEWFAKHLDEKPYLSITLVAKNLEDIRGIIKKAIIDNNIPLNYAKTFLYYFALGVQETLTEDWKSYDRTIGLAADVVTPISLLTVKIQENFREHTTIQGVASSDDPWMAMYILGIYRLIRATRSDNRTIIGNKITKQMKALVPSAPAMTNAIDRYTSWTNDREFNSLIAAFDMFFNKFPLHKYSNLKMATCGSRFRDCEGLMSFGYFMKLLGVPKPIDILHWVFSEKIADELEQMMKEGEELTDPYSYFPYQVDFGIVINSAYSATANPYFFQWVHLTGSLLRSERSMNARPIHDYYSYGDSQILRTAVCVAYAFSHTHKEDDPQDGSDETINRTLKSRNPIKWIIMLNNFVSCKLPPAVKKYLDDVVKSTKDTRKGTMDHYLKKLYGEFIY